MKIKKLFSFSSQKSSKSCDSLETILRQPQQQVGSSSGGSGGVKGDIHSEYVINENILVDLNTMNTKLIDFGSGCVLNKNNNNNSSSTVFTEYRGTRVYSPPEWVQQGRYTGDGLTVWSLGVLLYDMLCGDIPFTCDRDTCAGKLTWNRHLRLSDAAMDLVERCLTVLPEQRITLDSILSHPWLQESTPSLRASPSSVSLMSTSPVSSVTSSSSSPVLSDSLLDEVVASLQPASASLLVMTV